MQSISFEVKIISYVRKKKTKRRKAKKKKRRRKKEKERKGIAHPRVF